MARSDEQRAPPWRALLLAGGAGGAFAGLEVLAAALGGHPLDPGVSLGAALAIPALVLVATGFLLLLRLGDLRAAALGLALLSLGWAPDALRPYTLLGGDLLGVFVGCALLALAWRRPRTALVLGVLGALAVPVLRPDPLPRSSDPLPRSSDPLPGAPTPVADSGFPDLLLITVDTVRGDAALLPAPDDWQRYTLAIAPAPWTLPSLYSLMTGLPVRAHGGGLPTGEGSGAFSRPVDGLAWLPERLHSAGYRTRAVISNPHLRVTEGFDRGFDRFVHHDDAGDPQRAAAWADEWRQRRSGGVSRVARSRDQRVTAQALSWLEDDAPGPDFTWVHLLLPHEYARDAAAPPTGWRPGTADLALLSTAYEGNIAATRDRIATLTAAAGPATVVAVVSDHGEALGEDGRIGHGKTLDDVELHVPLALRGPGATPGQVRGHVAAHDLGATLLALAGLDGLPGRDLPGRDLRAGPAAAVEVGGVRRDGSAFARRVATGAYEARPPGARGQGRALGEEQLRALEALGYVEED